MTTKKGVLDFLTVAAEFCAFVESANDTTKRDFIDTSQKILSLLYLKAMLLPVNTDIEGYCEQYVTEDDWNFIQNLIQEKLGSHEAFIEIIEPDNYSDSAATQISISECFADMYQDIRNFIEQYKIGNDETHDVAIYECSLHFKMYWGPKALGVMSEFHNLLFAADSTIDEE